jgi:CheY-like chemotaxis protein
MSHTNGQHAAPDGTSCILVVDDDEATRQLLASILGRDGYRLVQAKDGEEALAAAYAQPSGPRRD